MDMIKELCSALEMPEEVTEEILQFEQELNLHKDQKKVPKQMTAAMNKLFHEETWTEGLAALRGILGEDPRGMKMLTCMMKCGLKTVSIYKELKIPEKIFIASLKCFPRFVKEYKESFGVYGFDREWWTVRQLSGKLFRIGELEYELRECSQENENEGEDNWDRKRKEVSVERYVSLHIPSDANLEPEAVRRSYREAGDFLHKYFPEYEHTEVRCSSWLLSPALSKVLPPSSRILCFQKDFIIHHVDEESDSFMQWVYKRSDLPLQMLPEETTLQRNLKQYLLTGGKVGEGAGKLSCLSLRF